MNKNKKKWEILERNADVTITYRTFPFYLLITVFAGIVGLVGLFMSGSYQISPETLTSPESILTFILFHAPWFLIPPVGIYALAALILDKRVIKVENGRIKARFSPVPLPGSISLSAAQVRQIFCKRDDGSYSLKLITDKGRTLVLLEDSPGRTESQEAERILEKSLGITDRKVRGEATSDSRKETSGPEIWAAPTGCSFNEENGILTFSLPGNPVMGSSALFAGIGFTAFSLLFIGQTVITLAKETPTWIFLALFLLVFVGAGLGIAYYGAVMIFNNTVYTVNGLNLKISQKPLPWIINRSYDIKGLSDIRKEKHTYRTRKGGTSSYWVLTLVYDNGGVNEIKDKNLGEEECQFFQRLIKEKVIGKS